MGTIPSDDMTPLERLGASRRSFLALAGAGAGASVLAACAGGGGWRGDGGRRLRDR